MKLIQCQEIKEHYSDDIKKAIEESIERAKTTAIVAPPGTGKTMGSMLFGVEVLSGVSPAIPKLKSEPEIVYYEEPTHTALSSAAEKIDKIFSQFIGISAFVQKPIAFILRGAFYSCINPELRDRFSEIIYEVFQNMIPEEYRGQVSPAAWSIYVRKQLEESEREELIRRLLDDIVYHYSYYSKLEGFYSFLCSVCPLNKTSIKVSQSPTTKRTIDLVEEFIRLITRSDISIVDSASEKARELIDILRPVLDKYGIEEVCPYRLLLKFALAESVYREVRKRRKIIFFMTHAMMFNPQVLQTMKQRYFLPSAVGRPVRHIYIIDEFDNPLLSPPTIRLPVHVAPRVGRVTKENVRKIASKYTQARGLDALCKLVELAGQLHNEIINEVAGIEDELERARKVTRVFAKWAREKLQKEDMAKLIKQADYFLTQWRRALLKKIRQGQLDIDHVVMYLICNEVFRFFSCLRESEVLALTDDKLGIVLSYPLVILGPRQGITVRFGSLPHTKGMLRVAYFSSGDLVVYLYDLAARVIFSSYYPYLTLAKIGLTATFSDELINSLIGMALTDTVVREIESSLSTGAELIINYSGLLFYIAPFWLSAANYEAIVYLIEKLETTGPDADYIRTRASTELQVTEPRKKLLSDYPSTKPQFRHMYKRALDVLLNIIHEIYYIANKVLRKNRVKAFIFVGTSPQLLQLGTQAVLILNQWITHGVLRLCITNIQSSLDYAIMHVKARDICGKMFEFEVAMSYAKSRYSRGIDLEDYDIAIMLSPPITPPEDIMSLEIGSVPGEFVGRNVAQSVVATCQCLFRIIRRAHYPQPKVILLDVSLVSPKYMTLYPRWFRELLEVAELTPALAFIEKPEETPDRYTA